MQIVRNVVILLKHIISKLLSSANNVKKKQKYTVGVMILKNSSNYI